MDMKLLAIALLLGVFQTGVGVNVCERPCGIEQECQVSGRCKCLDPNKTLLGDLCVVPKPSKFKERCGEDMVNQTLYECKKSEGLFCKDKKCLCEKDKYVPSNSTKCESKKLYLSKHNITNYKALVLDYCLYDNDCIDGLNCGANYTCECPRPCSYVKEKLVCDCGQYSVETPQNVLITGIILSILSTILWACCIRRTVKKYANQEPVSYDMEPVDTLDEEKSPPNDPPPSYNESCAPIGFNVDSTKATLPPSDSYGAPVTTNPPYPVGTETPPYPVNPTVPYPVAPQQVNTGNPPYPAGPQSGNTGNPPYPAGPQSGNAGNPPYPMNG